MAARTPNNNNFEDIDEEDEENGDNSSMYSNVASQHPLSIDDEDIPTS